MSFAPALLLFVIGAALYVAGFLLGGWLLALVLGIFGVHILIWQGALILFVIGMVGKLLFNRG